MKAAARNELLVAIAAAVERMNQSSVNEPVVADLPGEEELDRQGDLLVALGDALDADPAGITPLIIEALQRVNDEHEKRLRERETAP